MSSLNFITLSFYLIAALALGIALLAFFKDRSAPARRIFCAGLFLLALQCALAGAIYGDHSPARTQLLRSLWLIPQALSPAVWFLFILQFSRGNFRETWPTALPFLLPLLLLPLAAITFISGSVAIPSENELLSRDFRIGFGGFILYLCIIIGAALILIQAERTFRAAVGTMRWKIKYVILGVAILFTAKLYTASQVLLFKSHSASLDIVNAVALLLASLLFLIGLFRSGLFGVQVYPSEQVLQFSVAGLLVGAYLLLIGIFSKLFAGWQGPEAFAAKAFLLLASLALAGIFLLSERARDKLRRWISRHFHRPFYDYRSLWLSLTEKTATIVDTDTLARISAEWISEKLRVLSTSVWLVDQVSQNVRLAASTGISNAAERIPFTGELISALATETAPFDIDERTVAWAAELKQCFPDHFEGAGNRICVPLIAAGKLVGFCTLGDRVNYIPLETQEFELLKCVSDQIASNLLNLQLSKDLLQAKEMEAFQTIAAFFVHDLKNTASTLNLTLQNLPKHFDNPEFRKDALRAIGSSVNHIQNLIGRLTLFRQTLELKRVPTDLNECVRTTLASLKQTNAPIRTELASIPPVFADADQLQKVITNLVLNGLESLRGTGEVKISTEQQNGHVTLTVTDNGAGMTPEFIATGLYRPFKTTKKGGIGIGMFQTKTIIDAHGGRIQVRSAPGQGTTFTISLPLPPQS